MNTISCIVILVAGASAIALAAALLSYVSDRARSRKAKLVEARLAQQREPQIGAYEKARIERFLNEINTGRMTFEQAQHAIAREWIAAYEPIVHRAHLNRNN
jgi:uncharacterized protein with PIN domain